MQNSRAVESFLRDIEDSVRLPPHVRATDAAVATVCTLTLRLSPGEARDVFEALPEALRGLFAPCEKQVRGAGQPFGREEFLRRVAERLEVSVPDAERIALGVMAALRARLPEKEVEDIASQLPRPLKRLWLEAVPGIMPLLPRVQHFILDEIERDDALPAGVAGAQAFAAVMCALSEALGTEQARRLVDEFPRGLRLLFESCVPQPTRAPKGGATELGLRIAERLRVMETLALSIVRVVFRVVQRDVLSRQARDEVARSLPGDLHDIWLYPESTDRPEAS